MASYSTSTTGSIKYIPVNLSASEGLTINIDNPLQGSSYVVLETRKDADGKYTAFSPKNAQGTYTLSNITKEVHDDYKAGFVVPPGGGTVTFDNTNYVSGSEFRIQGTKYHPFYDTLLDRWPNAAAAYSLRLLNSYYEGPAIRVRRSIDDTESNIGFIGTELDTTALVNFTKNAGTALPGDYGDGPAAAYSLRYVTTAYTGPVIRVRRDSDDVEQDFTPSQITDGTLESFCGAGNGFVETWYDQSGNGNHASQTTASNQPQIVSSGSVVTENGKPSMEFDGSNDSLNLTQITPNTEWTMFGIGAKKDPSGIMTFLGSNNGSINSTLGHSFDGRGYLNNGTQYRQTNTTYTNTNQTLWSGVVASSLPQAIYRNSSLLSTTPVNAAIAQGFNMIGRYNDWYTTASISEILLYQSDQSPNRTDIESNINNYYNIFPFDSYVETWYDQSGNGNHTTQVTDANQPQIVSGGSVILDNGKPALQFDGSDDEILASLSSNITQPVTLFHVRKYISATQNGSYELAVRLNSTVAVYGDIYLIGGDNTFSATFGIYITLNQAFPVNNNQGLWYVLGNGNNSEVALDGVSPVIGAGGSREVEEVRIGGGSGAYPANILSQELIIYSSDQSSNRSGIESNINSHYKIY